MMRPIVRLALAVLTAALLLSLVAGSASALRTLSINERSIHAIFERLIFQEPEAGLGITCTITLRKVFNSNLFAKTAREVGNTVEMRTANCRDSLGVAVTWTPLIEARSPWILLFNGFTGTLPNITGLRLITRRFKFLIRDDNAFRRFACLYEGDIGFEATIARETGVISGYRLESGRSIPAIITLSGSCPTPLRFVGEGTVVRLRDLAGGVVIKLI